MVEHLFGLLMSSLKKIPSNIEFDFSEGTTGYLSGLQMDGKSTLFNDEGKCLVDYIDNIYGHATHEKVELLIGGYDGDYEEFFISPNENVMVVKRAAKNITGEDEHVVVRFKGQTLDMSRADFEAALEKFTDAKIDYERLGERINKDHDDYDDEFGSRKPTFWHNQYPREWDEPELDESDYKITVSSLYGGLLYKNLHHV